MAVAAVNDAPVAVNDTATTKDGVTLTTTAATGVLSNDTDVDSPVLTVTGIRTGADTGSGTAGIVGTSLAGTYGNLTLFADGRYSYTPTNATAVGTDTFTHTVSDGVLTDIAELKIVVDAVAETPTALTTSLKNSGTAYSVAVSKDDGLNYLYSINMVTGGVTKIGTVLNAASQNYDIEALTLGADGFLYAVASGGSTLSGLVKLSTTPTVAAPLYRSPRRSAGPTTT